MKEDRDPIWILVHRKMFRVFVEMLFFYNKSEKKGLHT